MKNIRLIIKKNNAKLNFNEDIKKESPYKKCE